MARVGLNRRSSFPEVPLTLIDTFVMEGFVAKERYYPGMLDCLGENEKRNLYFVPSYYQIRPWRIRKIMTELRASQKNIMFKETWLTLTDYLYAFMHSIRVRRMTIGKVCFKGFDLSDLIREEIHSFIGFGNAIAAFLNFRFAGRLKEGGVSLRKVVDSFENQVVDKGWNAGFNRFYPDVQTTGYLGVVTTEFYLCARPTSMEKAAGLLPSKIHVIGKALIPSHKEFCEDLVVETAPALRFSHLYENNRSKPKIDPVKTQILVALPFDFNEIKSILGLIANVCSEFQDDLDFLIKLHPTTRFEDIRELPCFRHKNIRIVDGVFGELLETSQMLISSASSVCLETIARGKPAIVVGNPNGMTLNPIPETIDSDIWRICHHEKEFRDAIRSFRNLSAEKAADYRKEGKRIRTAYFEPITPQAVRTFLAL